MFSGIIKELGTIVLNRGYRLEVAKGKPAREGDSIAVNGVCLTVVSGKKIGGNFRVKFDLSEETLDLTTLGQLSAGTKVNLENALALSESLGGHIVQGHVDGVGKVLKILPQKEGMKTISFAAPREVAKYLVSKGSIAIDGVSLTVIDLKGNKFSAALIPFTLDNTNLGKVKPGDKVNMEADIIGKFVLKYMKR